MHAIISLAILAAALGVLSLLALYFVRKAKTAATTVVTDTDVRDLGGGPLWTATSTIFARGEGGFGGERGPSTSNERPDREPDSVIYTATLPQQALWYRLLGDRNPLHSDPDFARAAGFPAPILHGLATDGRLPTRITTAQIGAARATWEKAGLRPGDGDDMVRAVS